MTPARHNAILSGLTLVATKVFNAVPIIEAWTVNQVISELQRQGQSVREHRVVAGCLASMKESGVVTEPEPGYFRRVAVRERSTTKPQPVAKVPPQEQELKLDIAAPSAPAKKPGQLDRLGAISAELRQQAKQLTQLADRIDAAAITTEEEIAALGEDSKKLRALQSILLPSSTAAA
jgi:hypothetical protein